MIQIAYANFNNSISVRTSVSPFNRRHSVMSVDILLTPIHSRATTEFVWPSVHGGAYNGPLHRPVRAKKVPNIFRGSVAT